MSRPRQRISVDGPQGGFAGAFAGLEIEGLPSLEIGCPQQASSKGVESGNKNNTPQRFCGRVVLRRLTAHRGGKVVIAIDGFEAHHTGADIDALARRLRAHCGCGGTVSERVVELQGDQVARIRAFLEAEGFRVSGEK